MFEPTASSCESWSVWVLARLAISFWGPQTGSSRSSLYYRECSFSEEVRIGGETRRASIGRVYILRLVVYALYHSANQIALDLIEARALKVWSLGHSIMHVLSGLMALPHGLISHYLLMSRVLRQLRTRDVIVALQVTLRMWMGLNLQLYKAKLPSVSILRSTRNLIIISWYSFWSFHMLHLATLILVKKWASI